MYRAVAVQAYLYAMQKYGPEAAKKMGWGGHFGTDIKTGGGEADTMHFDWLFKGIRGHIGNAMAEYNQAKQLFEQQKQAMSDTTKGDAARAASNLVPGGGAQLARPHVDNSVKTTVINGITDPHGVHRVVSDLGNRNSTYQMRNGRTYVG
jgi:hypothetical protein